MWLELSGSAAAWLAHVLWYLAPARRAGLVGLDARRSGARTPSWFRAAALLLAGVSALFWVKVHGPALGACSALAALMAAASLNTIVAPLAARAFWALGALSAAALLAGAWGWLSGA